MMSRHSMFTCLFIVGASEGDEVHSKSIFFCLNDKSFSHETNENPLDYHENLEEI